MQPKLSTRCAQIFVVALFASAWAGCASTYEVKVDAVRRPSPEARNLSSYQIRSSNPGVDPQSLRYKEAAKHVKTALSASGLFEAPVAASADLIVEIDYGVEPPHEKLEEIEVPVIEEVPVGPPRNEAAALNSDGSPVNSSGERNARECVGSAAATRRVVVCEKYMSVSGRQNKAAVEGQPPAELWRVHVSIEDESKDLRDYLPILASVAMDQVGKDTFGGQLETLSGKDEAIRFIKRGF